METKGRKKLFISGPVTGVPYYWREFEKAQGFYEEMGYAVMIPSELPVGMSNADYARICLSMIDSADEVAFLPGWRDSIGCKLEHDYCYYIRKPVRLFTDDVDSRMFSCDKEETDEKIREDDAIKIKARIDLTEMFRRAFEKEFVGGIPGEADIFETTMDFAVGQALENGYSVDFSSDGKGWRSISLCAPMYRMDVADCMERKEL